MDFQPFPKLTRLAEFSQHCVITEKVDGSNAQVVIRKAQAEDYDHPQVVAVVDGLAIRAGSRSRWVTPGKETDNYGFAAWVQANASSLVSLGEGQHFGEWFGGNIQCGYGQKEKRFALFNTDRWGDHNPNTPSVCEVVPIIHIGAYTEEAVEASMWSLALRGSKIVPGFMKPGGIVVYLRGPKLLLKKTFENDEGKWRAAA